MSSGHEKFPLTNGAGFGIDDIYVNNLRKRCAIMTDKALVLALVKAHLLLHPDYLSWVNSYTSLRWAKKKIHSVRIGGHYRRKAMYAQMLSSLSCTCKLQELVFEGGCTKVPPPPLAFKERWTKDGEIIPIRHRQLEFV